METKNNSNRIHPLVAAAAIGVLLVSLVGVAAMTGMLPNSNSASAQKEAIAALDKEAAEKAAEAKAAEERANEARMAAQKTEDEKAHQARLKEEDRRIAERAKARESAPSKVAQAQVCYDCGRVESVRSVQTAAKPSGVGVVGGAVVGGLLGNQIGNGSGRSLATVAGAVGGGFAGNEIEKRTRTASTYEVRVRMEDGKIRTFPYDNQPNWSTGDRVRVVDGYLRAR
ncbi:glycine zipper 2TM domain-containing protein [Herminiimonas sp. NPDC097707]|uniref:glycine zipper 2TM domain-containing protein n=1 Tax=Herminiimonas sp. NPDC097707 TaxID=3364007 RepID=UPI00383A6AE3